MNTLVAIAVKSTAFRVKLLLRFHNFFFWGGKLAKTWVVSSKVELPTSPPYIVSCTRQPL